MKGKFFILKIARLIGKEGLTLYAKIECIIRGTRVAVTQARGRVCVTVISINNEAIAKLCTHTAGLRNLIDLPILP